MAESRGPLEGVMLTSSGLDMEERNKIMAMAEELGAVFSPHLTQECTHVLARAWNSAKCKCAAELGRPVLLPDWILACYNNRKNAGYNFKASADSYRLPIFQGCLICVTGIANMEERKQIQRQVETNGGTFDSDLSRQVTHLIATAPTGDKYRFAQKFDIPVVSLQWYKECLERGARLPEEQYAVPGGTELPSSKASNSVQPFRPTATGTGPSAPAPSAASAAPSRNTAARQASLPAPAAAAAPAPAPVPAPPEPESDGISDLLDASPVDSAPYLDNQQFYFSRTIPESKIAQLKRIVRSAGGMTREEYSAATVTHYICPSAGKLPPEDEKLLRAQKKLPYILDYLWLRECLRQQAAAPIEAYVVQLPASLASIPAPPNAKPPLAAPATSAQPSVSTTSLPPTAAPAGTRTAQVRKRAGGRTSDQFDELLGEFGLNTSAPQPIAGPSSAVAPQPVSAGPSSRPPMAPLPATTTSGQPRKKPTPLPAIDTAADAALAPQGDAFRDVTILLYGFTPDQVVKIKERIEGFQGTCLVQVPMERPMGQCYVVTLLTTWVAQGIHVPPEVASFGTRATAYWLQDCLDDARLYPVSEHVVFRPARIAPLPDFTSHIVTVTGFDGTDRDRTVRLITDLGAQFSDQLKKNRTTHMIGGPQIDAKGSKVAKAQEWGVKVVGIEWLYAGLAEGRVVPSEEYELVEPEQQDPTASGRSFKFRRPADNSAVEVRSGGMVSGYLNSVKAGNAVDNGALLHPRLRLPAAPLSALPSGSVSNGEGSATSDMQFKAILDGIVSKPTRKRARPAKRENEPPPPPSMEEDNSQKGAASFLHTNNSQERDDAGFAVEYDDPEARQAKKRLLKEVQKKLKTPPMDEKEKRVVVDLTEDDKASGSQTRAALARAGSRSSASASAAAAAGSRSARKTG